MYKVGAITLGCDKNRVDTERLLAEIVKDGYSLVADVEEADIAIVNTCAFIDSAKKESIATILEVAELKKTTLKKLIVAGCFSQRYKDAVKDDFPEVDAFIGIDEIKDIASIVDGLMGQHKKATNCGDAGRILTTPPHYAFLKIADGCNNRCTYCAIPSIRGSYRSEPIEKLLKEAKGLADSGVKELIIVAQDSTVYGKDLYGKPRLLELLQGITELSFRTVRLLYAYPESVTEELIRFISQQPKMAKYIDIPLQHISSPILKKMNRRIDEDGIRKLLRMIKEIDKDIVIRSSFIVGFPTETEEDVTKLTEFVAEGYVDYSGFFEYSREEGTSAARLEGQIKQADKRARRIRLEKTASRVVEENHAKLLGKKVAVVFEGLDEKKGLFYGRMSTQCPTVDPVVYLKSDSPIEAGQYYEVEIVKTGFNLNGVVIREL